MSQLFALIVLVTGVMHPNTFGSQVPDSPPGPTMVKPQYSTLTNRALVKLWFEKKLELRGLLDRKTDSDIERCRGVEIEVFQRMALIIQRHLEHKSQAQILQFWTENHPKKKIRNLVFPAGSVGVMHLIAETSPDFDRYFDNLLQSEEPFAFGTLVKSGPDGTDQHTGMLAARFYPDVAVDYQVLWDLPKKEIVSEKLLILWGKRLTSN